MPTRRMRPSLRQAAFTAIGEVLSASVEISAEAAKHLKRVAELYGINAGKNFRSGPLSRPLDPRATAS